MQSRCFQTKAEARLWGLRMRAAMSTLERSSIAAQATRHLTASPLFSDAATILSYVGSRANELDTRPLIQQALDAGKTVLVPVTLPRGEMRWSVLECPDALVPTERGLMEPHPGARMWLQPAGGLCIVPGICFRDDGHRIGFGAGYFDRFLPTFAGVPIALAPHALFGVSFPVEPHDRPVSWVVTEAGIYAAQPVTSE